MSAWTVGDLRKALDGTPDEAELVVMTGHGSDLAVHDGWQSGLIPWAHDCTDAPDTHRPGRDCPTATGFEIHAAEIGEIS